MNNETINIKRLSFVYARDQQLLEQNVWMDGLMDRWMDGWMNRCIISSLVFIIRYLYLDAMTLSVYYVHVEHMLIKRYLCIN